MCVKLSLRDLNPSPCSHTPQAIILVERPPHQECMVVRLERSWCIIIKKSFNEKLKRKSPNDERAFCAKEKIEQSSFYKQSQKLFHSTATSSLSFHFFFPFSFLVLFPNTLSLSLSSLILSQNCSLYLLHGLSFMAKPLQL